MFITEYLGQTKSKNHSNLLINLSFGFLPISYFFGNLIVNLNFFLFCCLGIFYLKSKILKTKYGPHIKIIFLFFILIIISTSFSFIKSLYFEDYQNHDLERLIKSILFFRFFLFLIIVYLLSKFDILNFKYFFISAAFSPILLSLDVIYQYIFGYDILGFKNDGLRNGGFFGDEFIAGAYIERFSFFAIFFTIFTLQNRNYTKFTLAAVVTSIVGVGILVSGNRMPLVLFLFGIFFTFFFNIKIKKILFSSLVCLLIFLNFTISSNESMQLSYGSMYSNVKTILFEWAIPEKANEKSDVTENVISEIDTENKSSQRYQAIRERLLLTAIDTWKPNKIFGNGIKSFRFDCSELLQDKNVNLEEDFKKDKKNRLCSNHPHNYYLEILTEIGILGILLLLTTAVFFMVFVIKNYKFLKGNDVENFILLAAIISLILEMFPFRSSGSFFASSNANYIMLISSIVLCYKKLLKIKIQ